ncbi:MAG: hypothetical protein ISN28_08465 [Ectothiorhodospiraceae bacterium AqS1]|nr:hypothetical protein [Ectothiorhodospiraceae bacterium AqS1]
MFKTDKDTRDQFPVMHPDSIDYVDGEYKVDIKSDADANGINVHHSLIGDNLVSQYILEEKAIFATEVVSPSSTYREIIQHEWADNKPSLEAKQSVTIDKEKVVSPYYYRPLVIVKNAIEKEKIILQAKHGIQKFFYDNEMSILPGTILAKDKFWNSEDYLFQLLKIDADENLTKGSFEVDDITNEGFYFKVRFATDLYELITRAQGDQCNFRDAILTFALSEGLNIIYREYRGDRGDEVREDENPEGERWRMYPALCRLYEEIDGRNLPCWDSKDFKPERIATALKPIIGVMRNDEND